MTIKKKWIMTILLFSLVGIGVEILASTTLNFYGAKHGAFLWLNQTNDRVMGVYNEQLSVRLLHDVQALSKNQPLILALEGRDWDHLETILRDNWLRVDEDDFWYVVLADGTTVSSLAQCRKAQANVVPDTPRIIWCSDVPALSAPFVQGQSPAELYLAHRLWNGYVDVLKRLTGTEIELWSMDGALATTTRNLTNERVFARYPPELAARLKLGFSAADPYLYDVQHVGIPAYGGYGDSAFLFAEGQSAMDIYVHAASLDRTLQRPLNVVSFVPTDVMTIGARYSLIAMLALGVIMLALLTAVSWTLVSRFVKPLKAIESAARQIAKGDMTVQVDETGGQEIVNLGRAFNHMAKDLKLSHARALQSEKLAAVGQLAGGIAHEINNPLGVILGFAQGMQRRVAAGDPMFLPVSSIAREAIRCKDLVQELLTFSRTGQTTTEKVDLSALVRSAALLLESRAKIQAVQVAVELEVEGLVVEANRSRLQQVLINLGNNALDAMDQGGGTLTLRAHRNGDNGACIEVADTGCGITDTVKAHVFEPFFTTKDVGKGTGLGLSLVHEIVQQHHGEISLESASALARNDPGLLSRNGPPMALVH